MTALYTSRARAKLAPQVDLVSAVRARHCCVALLCVRRMCGPQRSLASTYIEMIECILLFCKNSCYTAFAEEVDAAKEEDKRDSAGDGEVIGEVLFEGRSGQGFLTASWSLTRQLLGPLMQPFFSYVSCQERPANIMSTKFAMLDNTLKQSIWVGTR